MALLSAGAAALVKPATSPLCIMGVQTPHLVLPCTGVAMDSKSKECTRTIHHVEVSDVADEDAASGAYRSCLCCLMVPHDCWSGGRNTSWSQEAAGGSYIGIGAVRTGCFHIRLWCLAGKSNVSRRLRGSREL